MIPDVNRREWKDLLLGNINPKLSSLSLKLKLNALKMKLKSKKLSISEAVTTIHAYCSSNPKIYSKDLNAIFKR